MDADEEISEQAVPKDFYLNRYINFSEEACHNLFQEVTGTKVISTCDRPNELGGNSSSTQNMKGGTKSPIMESPAEISVEATTTGSAYTREHSDISHLLFAVDIQIHNVQQGSTTDLPYSLSYSDLVAISQALEEIKDVREHLMLYRNFSRDSNTTMKESSEDEEVSINAASNREEGVTSSAMDNLFKVVAGYDAEIERLTRDSQGLGEQVKKLTDSNDSLVKQNIALRQQTRHLKNASIYGMPFASSSRTSKYISSAGAQSSHTTANSPSTEIHASPKGKQIESPLSLQPLLRIPNMSGLAKIKERLGKLLGSWKAKKHESPNSIHAHKDKDKHCSKRQPMCDKPLKLRKKRMSFNEKILSNSPKTSACVSQGETLLESATSDLDDATDNDINEPLAKFDDSARLVFFMLFSALRHLGHQQGMPYQELRRGVLLDLETNCSAYLNQTDHLADFDTIFEDAYNVLKLHYTADGLCERLDFSNIRGE